MDQTLEYKHELAKLNAEREVRDKELKKLWNWKYYLRTKVKKQ